MFKQVLDQDSNTRSVLIHYKLGVIAWVETFYSTGHLGQEYMNIVNYILFYLLKCIELHDWRSCTVNTSGIRNLVPFSDWIGAYSGQVHVWYILTSTCTGTICRFVS